MIEKKFCTGIFFFILLFVGFFYLAINRVSAVNLEINYPPIPGSSQTITAETELPGYMKYLFDAGMFFGFFAVTISLTIAGVMYFLSPAKPDLLANAKDRVSGAISGLLILTLTYLIITTINPQLSFFTLNEPPPTTPPSPKIKKAPGVYFYESGGCSDADVKPKISNVTDMGILKNKVKSVGIVQNLDNQTFYITILHDNINLWGRCQYITTDSSDPAQTCKDVDPFTASASIYEFDRNPDGDGVYFYRKSCFNNQPTNNIKDVVEQCNKNSGGYYFISNQEIMDNSIKGEPFNLNELYFDEVPDDEQDCTGYDENGECVSRTPPSLGGENISSIIINGGYLVVFIYTFTGQWDACQPFPIINDINKFGPQQIKWENIRNDNGVIPNYFIIIPIKK